MPRVVEPGAADDALPLTRDGRPVRAAATAPARVSPLHALAGAALAVAGVALGIGALLSVTGVPEGSPALGRDPGGLVAAAAEDAETDPVDAAAMGSPPEEPQSAEPTTPVATPAPASAPARATASARPAPAAANGGRTDAAAPARPALVVLNNSTRTGLADRAAARFARNGWPVQLVGNYRGRIRATTVYYGPGQRAAAQRFAGTFRGVERVLPRPARMPGPRGLVVVLTRSFPA